jgi:hypothetical protein
LDREIREVNEEKKIAYRRCSNTKSIHDKINHKRLSTTPKRERREIKRLSCEKFTSKTEHDLGK